ncbi:hypothetical protein DPMN_058727 [Dreissena polymorpha]|uniref:MADF domain-containing protein n=1 Tax=Dreissena polymorpha TaxID=45954 RepID=A0A9D4C2L5_DREPO|nr:hypothetical protein DPMN_058727 [Dreissena polymorpha]
MSPIPEHRCERNRAWSRIGVIVGEQIEDAPVETPSPQDDAPKKTKFPRTTTTYTDQQKEEILDFLKANPSIYEKRRADYKNMQLKESLWQQQADKMGTKDKNGKASKKSGLSDEVFSATDQWVWDNFQFLVPHIVDVQRRNVVSFKSKIPTSNASFTSQQSTDAGINAVLRIQHEGIPVILAARHPGHTGSKAARSYWQQGMPVILAARHPGHTGSKAYRSYWQHRSFEEILN